MFDSPPYSVEANKLLAEFNEMADKSFRIKKFERQHKQEQNQSGNSPKSVISEPVINDEKITAKLQVLKEMRDEGIITDKEYQEKRDACCARTGLSKLAESNYIGISADKFFEMTQARRLTRDEVLEIRNNKIIIGETSSSRRKQVAEYLRIFSYADGTSTIEQRRQFDNSIVKTAKQNLWSVDDEGMISYRKSASSPPRRLAIYGTSDGKYFSLYNGKVNVEFRIEGPIPK